MKDKAHNSHDGHESFQNLIFFSRIFSTVRGNERHFLGQDFMSSTPWLSAG
jgi:hypothetical protein